MRLDQLLQNEMSQLLQTIQEHSRAIIAEKNSDEDLHDIRVAFRRLKSIFKSLAFAFDERFVKLQRDCIALIFSTTNEIRDNDVFLVNLQSYHGSLSKGKREQIVALKDELSTKKAAYYDYLRYFLKSRVFNAYLDALERDIKTEEIFTAEAKVDAEKLYKKLLKREIKSFLKEAKKIQTILGEHQDIYVELNRLKKLKKERKLSPKTYKQLKSKMQKRSMKLRKAFQKSLKKLKRL